MALKELQSAAVRLVHVVQPTDRDVATLQKRFSLHPHDVEAVLAVQQTNTVRPFRDYVFASFVWPVYRPEDRDLRLQEFTIILGPSWLIMVEPEASTEIDAFVTEHLRPENATAQTTATSLLGELIARLARRTDQQASWFAGDVVTTIGDRDAQAYGQGLLQLADHVHQLMEHLPSPDGPDSHAMLQIAAHRLHHRGQLLQVLKRSTVRNEPASFLASPQLVRGYAWASAGMVVLMLGWLIGH